MGPDRLAAVRTARLCVAAPGHRLRVALDGPRGAHVRDHVNDHAVAAAQPSWSPPSSSSWS